MIRAILRWRVATRGDIDRDGVEERRDRREKYAVDRAIYLSSIEGEREAGPESGRPSLVLHYLLRKVSHGLCSDFVVLKQQSRA